MTVGRLFIMWGTMENNTSNMIKSAKCAYIPVINDMKVERREITY